MQQIHTTFEGRLTKLGSRRIKEQSVREGDAKDQSEKVVTVGDIRVRLDLTRRSPSEEFYTWNFSDLSAEKFWDHPDAREIRDDIIRMAIEKEFGRRCFWFPDSGIGWRHGQVFEALRATKRNSHPGNSSVTSLVRLTIDIDGVAI